MTDDKYKGKMVVIVAGYVHDIDELMESNPGLASRFPETLHFPNFGVDDCCHLFKSVLKRGYSTELAPGAAEVLRELLPPIVEVRHAIDARRGVLVLWYYRVAVGVSICYSKKRVLLGPQHG